MASNAAFPHFWPTSLPSRPELPPGADIELSNLHTSLRNKIEVDFRKQEGDEAGKARHTNGQRKILVANLTGYLEKLRDGENATVNAFVAEWRAIVQQAIAMLTMTKIDSSLIRLKDEKRKSTQLADLTSFVEDYHVLHSILDSVFNDNYSPSTHEEILVGEAASDTKTLFIKAVLDMEPAPTDAEAAKQTLLSPGGPFGPKASGVALAVRSALLAEEQANNSFSTPFEKIFFDVRSGKNSWAGVYWKKLKQIEADVHDIKKFPLLADRFKEDNGRPTMNIAFIRHGGKKRKAGPDQPDSASKRGTPSDPVIITD